MPATAWTPWPSWKPMSLIFMVIDIMMPLMDGYQLCEAVRRHPRFSRMQVLFLSAFASKDNIKRGYAVGANLFMTKPVDPERVLKKHRVHD